MGGLKDDGDGRADIDLAFQPNTGVVDAGNVLDDGQPQPGAASGLTPALIDPVEPLEHAGLGFFRDADAIVLDGQGAVPIPCAGGDELDLSAGAVVPDGVVAKVLA